MMMVEKGKVEELNPFAGEPSWWKRWRVERTDTKTKISDSPHTSEITFSFLQWYRHTNSSV
jgi:transposase